MWTSRLRPQRSTTLWVAPVRVSPRCSGYVPACSIELAAAALLMLIAGIVSYLPELGQLKNILISLLRCFLQLLASGFLLRLLFDWQTWWMVLPVLLFMLFVATQIATSGIKNKVPGLYIGVFLSLSVSSLSVGFLVVEAVIHAEPWCNARLAPGLG